MALTDSLNNKTERELIDGGDFIGALVKKLQAGADDNGVYTKKGVNDEFVKIDGGNANEAGVIAMLDKLTGDKRVVKANGDNAGNILSTMFFKNFLFV